MKSTFNLKEKDVKRLIERQLRTDGYEIDSISFKMIQRDYNGDAELETVITINI